MSWIPSNSDLGTHPKTRKAARRLEVSVPTLMGHLHLLWHWCIKHAVNGNITQVDQEDLADAMMWPGEPQKLIGVLCEVGFIDKTTQRDGNVESMLIHDWHEYAGKYDHRRKKNAEYKGAQRQREAQAQSTATQKAANADFCGEGVADVSTSCACSVADVSTQNREEKKREEKSTNSVAPAAQDARAGGFLKKSSSRPNIEGELAMAVRQVCQKGLALSARDREKLQATLAGLEREGATVAQVEEFGRKCSAHWISYDSRTKQSRAPNITQVLEHWHEVRALPEPVRVKSWKELDALAAKFEKPRKGS